MPCNVSMSELRAYPFSGIGYSTTKGDSLGVVKLSVKWDLTVTLAKQK